MLLHSSFGRDNKPVYNLLATSSEGLVGHLNRKLGEMQKNGTKLNTLRKRYEVSLKA